jgi:adenylate kinase family enzyme
MKKVIVIGCSGSGKTTFSEKLRDKSGLPLYYLDAIWHKPDKTHISRDEFDIRLGQILEREEWIIDGNYSRTMERRMAASDTVILFDLPTAVCLDGITARIGTKRPDIPWIDTELDPVLKKQTEEFKSQSLPDIYRMIEKYKEGRKIVVFKSREESDEFLRHTERA